MSELNKYAGLETTLKSIEDKHPDYNIEVHLSGGNGVPIVRVWKNNGMNLNEQVPDDKSFAEVLDEMVKKL